MSKEKSKKHTAAYLFLEKDGKILLHLRKNTGFADGNYSLIAGHIDENETAKQAIIRETKEEAGILIKPEDLEIVHIMHRNGNREYIDFFFSCKKWDGNINNCEPEKCGKLQFFEKSNLPENTLDYVTLALKNALSGKFFSEVGFE